MHQADGNERFVLFGDNAYLNTPYMATPFTNVAGDPNRVAEDSYNFYHSQLRIRIECAFCSIVAGSGRQSKRSIGLITGIQIISEKRFQKWKRFFC